MPDDAPFGLMAVGPSQCDWLPFLVALEFGQGRCESGSEADPSYDRRMHLTPTQRCIAALAAIVVSASSCAARSVADEARLIEVRGDRAYICLSDAINTSDPPSCASDIGTRDNPELQGRMVGELISVLGGTTDSVKVTASERDGEWFLEGFAAPE